MDDPSNRRVNIKMSSTNQSKMAVQSTARLKSRKQSYGFGAGVPGVGGGAKLRNSKIGNEYKRPALVYLNTYQLKPRVKFHPAKVQKTIDDILDSSFYTKDHKYNAMDSPGDAMLLADEILRAVKALNFDRYRIIAVVTLAQKRAQSYNNAVAFLWDHEVDGVVDCHREDTTSFLQVTVFGIYLD